MTGRGDIAYEPLDMELRVFDPSSNAKSNIDTSRAPSYLSGLTAHSGVDDDERSLISHHKPSAHAHVLENTPGDGEASLRPRRKRRSRLKSWKVGVTVAAATTSTVLFVNIGLTIWASVKYGLDNGIGTAYEGSCKTVSTWSFWLHIVINGLSSLLLSASNYTMQCVTAPTRRECDIAHSQGSWLDIGVPSVRNLFKIGRSRRVLWALLALSSTPIHLLYNSAVFKTLDDNDYDQFMLGRTALGKEYALPSKETLSQGSDYYTSSYSFFSLVNGFFTPTNVSYVSSASGGEDTFTYDEAAKLIALQEIYASDPSTLENLTAKACIDTYATYYLSGHGSVMLVADDADREIEPTIPIPYWGDVPSNTWIPFKWMCTQGVSTCKNPANARSLADAGWTVNGTKIDYCLSQKFPEHCKLQFSVYILIAVILCNAVKCAAMFLTIWKQRDTTFITFGDALADWLDKPDRTTWGRCFDSVRTVRRGKSKYYSQTSQQLIIGNRRWQLGVSRKRWLTTMCLLVAAVIASCTCFGMTMAQMKRSTADTISSLGFGTVNSNMLLEATLPDTGTSGLASSVLFANMPQLILSFVYLSLNALVTCMLLAKEYSDYEVHRKPLRVTTPYGQQRTTYYLQIPYIYGIPIITTSAVLHWLISQSVFLVRVDQYVDGHLADPNESLTTYTNSNSANASGSLSAVGLSPAPMLVVVLLGIFITSAAIAIGFRRLSGSAMPVAASCSLALAAAAHRPEGDVDAATLPVQWGEVVEMGDAEVGHCCFTSQQVVDAVAGKKYA